MMDFNEQHEAALADRTRSGDEAAMTDLFAHYRPRLRHMIDLRMNQKLRRRVDPSDVLQETFVDLAAQLETYANDPKLPVFIWMRRLAGQRLIMAHRKHIEAKKRSVELELAIAHGVPEATTFAMSVRLIGNLTGPESAAERNERQLEVQNALNSLSPDDREILAMRHFEQLSNSDVATILEITEATAGMRFLRALRKLKQKLQEANLDL